MNAYVAPAPPMAFLVVPSAAPLARTCPSAPACGLDTLACMVRAVLERANLACLPGRAIRHA
jgi:hypothetical protein